MYFMFWYIVSYEIFPKNNNFQYIFNGHTECSSSLLYCTSFSSILTSFSLPFLPYKVSLLVILLPDATNFTYNISFCSSSLKFSVWKYCKTSRSKICIFKYNIVLVMCLSTCPVGSINTDGRYTMLWHICYNK